MKHVKIFEDFNEEVRGTLDSKEIEFLKMVKQSKVLLRKFMDSEEISLANRLVKRNWLVKGISSEKPHSIIYYVDLSREDYKNII